MLRIATWSTNVEREAAGEVLVEEDSTDTGTSVDELDAVDIACLGQRDRVCAVSTSHSAQTELLNNDSDERLRLSISVVRGSRKSHGAHYERIRHGIE